MCGIAGLLRVGGADRDDRQRVAAMCDAMAYRGPDSSGIVHRGPVVLGHRRLSIIDVATGQQPMSTDDGTCTLAYNGEIYNYRELRDELAGEGCTFRTASDTEVILRLYERHGPGAVKRLRGMFAFALWDERRERLLLARDRVGIKPLYHAMVPSGMAFASELGALRACGMNASLDPQAVDEYFAYGYVPGPRTIYKDVFKLPAGCTLELEMTGDRLGVPRVEHFWQLPDTPEVFRGTYQDAKDQFRLRLAEAIKMHLVSEVPLGAFLSGGIDSSVVVGAMAQAQSAAVKTFSIGFHGGDRGELEVARKVARHFGTDHHEEIVTPSAIEVLPELLAAYGEPFADASAVPTYYVCRAARKSVTVALSGDGGDELFGGYRRYLTLLRERLIPRWIGKLISPVRHLTRVESRARNTLTRLGFEQPSRYAWFRSNFTPEMRARLFRPELRSAVSMNQTQVEFLGSSEQHGGNLLEWVQKVDFRTYLVDDVLTKVDRASMLHSLEVRVPLLDHELVEFVHALPSEYKVSSGVTKRILRDLLAEIGPPEVLSLRKTGFSVPLDRWLRGELREHLREVIESDTYQRSGWFDGTYVKRLFDLHQSGRVDLGWPLWQLIVYDTWVKAARV